MRNNTRYNAVSREISASQNIASCVFRYNICRSSSIYCYSLTGAASPLQLAYWDGSVDPGTVVVSTGSHLLIVLLSDTANVAYGVEIIYGITHYAAPSGRIYNCI